jgi:D-arabinose 1-dehydrogenase-like Zn-dependent alcohol dehydrogenase
MTDPNDDVDVEVEVDVCAICGRDLWWTGLPPARDGDAWICGDCDAARNFEALDLD